MAPKLYYMPLSPPARAVLACAKVLNIDLELVVVDLHKNEQLTDDFLKKNPQHTIPTLEDDDGFIVIDSHAIMAYLVEKYGKEDSLYPKDDYKQQATINHRLHFDTGILFDRGVVLARALIYQGLQPTQDRLDALREAFQILDRFLENSKTDYVAGNTLTIADFSIITTVTSWSVFVPYTDFPNLNAYIERMQEQPWYEANKEGLATLHEALQTKLK